MRRGWPKIGPVLSSLFLLTALTSTPTSLLHVFAEGDARSRGCGMNVLVADALRRHLTDVSVVVGGRASEGELSFQLHHHPPSWQLELSDSNGPLLTRMLPDEHEGCARVADASAIVLDRFLRDLDWTAQKSLAGETPDLPDAPDLSPPPMPMSLPEARASISLDAHNAVPAAPAPKLEQPKPEPPKLEPPLVTYTVMPTALSGADAQPAVSARLEPAVMPRWIEQPALLAGAAAILGVPGRAAPALTLEASLRVQRRFRAALWVAGDLPAVETITINGAQRGTLSANDVWGLVSGAYCQPLGPTELCGGVGAGIRASFASVSSDVDLYHLQHSTLALPTAGALGRWEWKSRAGFAAALQGAALFPLVPGSFEVQGVPSATVSSPTVDIALSLQLGWIFS